MKENPQSRLPRVLIVDDEEATRHVLSRLLGTAEFEVVTAESAAEARAMVDEAPPDVILLDVMMPGKDGFEFCRELKQDARTRLIPVVLLTGLSRRADRVQGIEAGADDFLSKPIYQEELLARVRSLIKLKEFTDELDHAEVVVETLALGVEARDPYTQGHCERLSHYAASLGRRLKLDDESIVALRRGGVLHDIGKIVVPDEVLKKGDRLTPEEWAIMKQHPVTGESICKPLKSLRLVTPIIRHHHEHWDGSGYPDGLRGKDIPLLARILQVVDVYDALRTERPYKPARTQEDASSTMKSEAQAGLWDKDLADEFFVMMAQDRAA
ncbi:MAG: HD-GYP domain-containing protein [Terriglobales bacterium]